MTEELNVSIDSQQLETIVATALEQDGVRLGEWQAEPLHGSLDPRNRLLRLAGQAHTPAGDRSWSLVLKIISGAGSTEVDPAGHRYWRREALFYQSGLLSDLSGSLVAPRCYRVTESGDGYWLWLEEVRDTLSRPWPVEHYVEVARCLGAFNGAYLAGRPLPEQPWLSRHCLRRYVETAAQNVQDLPELRKLWYFQRSFPTLSNDLLLEAWERRADFIGALERLPQTFCHQDAFAGNLFWRRGPTGQGQLVAIDWSFAGIAAVGEELAPLTLMASLTMGMEPADSARIYQACLEGYLAGLADAGWPADPQLVLFSCLTARFYRYLFGATLGELWTAMRDEYKHAMVTAMFGAPSLDVLLDGWASATLGLPAAYQEISALLKQYS
jgi:hypothetical protein